MSTRLLLLLTLLLGACAEETLPCVEVDEACTPLFEPTFDNLHERVLATTCSQSGGSCHASAGAKAGLVFEDADDSYDRLLGLSGGEAKVVPGDASCSVLMRRIRHPEPAVQMPPGKPLSDAAACAFQRWIEAGAPR